MAASLDDDFDRCGGAEIRMWRQSNNCYRKQGLTSRISTSPIPFMLLHGPNTSQLPHSQFTLFIAIIGLGSAGRL